jgi:hypothetical protein
LHRSSTIIKHFFIHLMHSIKYVDTIKIIKYLKVLEHVLDHRGSIIRERCTVLGKNYTNDSIVSVDMDKVSVMAAYSDLLCVCVCVCVVHCRVPSYTVQYTHAKWVRICRRNTDLVHVNGHDRIILVILSQALYKAPWWRILCDPKHVRALLNIL